VSGAFSVPSALRCAVALARSALGAPAARRLRLGCPLCDRRGEIALRLGNDPGAELLAQHPRAHLLDRALGELAELERSVGDADQPVHLQAEIAEHVPHLAVLALPDRKGEPHVRPLLAVERRLDRPVLDAVDRDATAQAVEVALRHLAERAHAIAPQPTGRRQLQHPCEPAVIGEQQQAFGADVEPSDREQARQVLGQRREDGRPAFGVRMGGHETARLVVEEEPGALARRQRRTVDRDAVGGGHVAGGRGDRLAVDRDAAGRDPRLGLAARGKTGARDHLGDAFALLVTLRQVLVVALASHRALVDKRSYQN